MELADRTVARAAWSSFWSSAPASISNNRREPSRAMSVVPRNALPLSAAAFGTSTQRLGGAHAQSTAARCQAVVMLAEHLHSSQIRVVTEPGGFGRRYPCRPDPGPA
jgi:hypothetical protein